ncbi:HAD family hydrolase [Peptoniphilus raoultii]|uniref:HAD family hydrolase n=1 Tax=Peptoniphilus raoultii TaxID=1776387 RepID=UPI0008D9E5ED|nr:HAD-IA family hydrolase [Peptoniphilus raoultii]
MIENFKSIIFDFDGTLHKTSKIYTPALAKGIKFLQDKGYLKDFELTDDYASKFLGYSARDAWKLIVHGLPEDLIQSAMKIVGSAMDDNLKEGRGELYKNSQKTLEILRGRGKDLYLLSNARVEYLDIATEVYDIKKYFKKIYAAESFDFIPKDQIIEKIQKEMEKEIIVVGDRFHDIEGAEKNFLKSAFALYGYGNEDEGKNADYKISDISELLELF